MLTTKIIINYLHKKTNRLSVQEKTFTYLEKILKVNSFTYPYKYSILDDFLNEENYKQVTDYYKKLKEDYKKNFGYADIYKVNTAKVPYAEFPFFYSTEFYELIKNISGENNLVTDIAATMHHNTPTDKDKYIHSDHSVILARKKYNHTTVLKNIWLDPEYKVKHFLKENESYNKDEYQKLTRSVTVIYYFDNESEDLGGETGIFVKNKNAGNYLEVDAVKCKNNRLLIFENNEISFHNYKKCTLKERSCLAIWFHVE